MRRLLVLGVGMPVVLTAMLVGIGVARGWWAEPEPVDEWARFAHTTAVDGLAIVVERGDELVSEQDITYTIAVGNRQPAPQTVTVQVAVPPWLTVAAPPAGGVASAGAVDWPVTVAPGVVTTMQLTGVYASPGPDVPDWVTLTACVLEQESDRPIACDTDAGHLDSSI